MGKIKGFLFAVRHREILMTDLGLMKRRRFRMVTMIRLVSVSAMLVDTRQKKYRSSFYS